MKNYGGKLVGLLAGAILLCATAMGQNGGLRFTLTDLGTFGGAASAAHAINNRGQVVGTFGIPNGRMCFLWQSGATPITFGGDAKPQFCDARAIGVDGTIAGSIRTQKTGSTLGAFRRDPTGTVNLLTPLPGSGAHGTSYSWGFGVYKKTVVGLSKDQAVRWDSLGNINTVFLPGVWSQANGLNSRGQVVGVRVGPCGGGSGGCGWMWENGSLADLPTGNYGSSANAINNNGFVVGYNWNSSNNFSDSCAAQWYVGTLTELACGWFEALANSSDNWVVGGIQEDYITCSAYTFIDCIDNCSLPGNACALLVVPDPACSPTNLNTLLDASGSGWNIVSGTGINDSHQIVGWGNSPVDGQLHAILLTPNNLPLCYPD
jgi:hypothetical protein